MLPSITYNDIFILVIILFAFAVFALDTTNFCCQILEPATTKTGSTETAPFSNPNYSLNGQVSTQNKFAVPTKIIRLSPPTEPTESIIKPATLAKCHFQQGYTSKRNFYLRTRIPYVHPWVPPKLTIDELDTPATYHFRKNLTLIGIIPLF